MKYKLIVFDLDGTLIDGTDSIWRTLHKFFGIDEHPDRIAIRDKFRKGKITYKEWAFADLELLKRYGANKYSIEKAMRSLKLMKNANYVLESLKKKGYKIAVVSGSFNIVLEKFIPNFEKIFEYVYIHKIFFDRDGEIKGIEVAEHDKEKILLEICNKEGFSPKECVFVGDHENDINAAKIAGISIAFNPKSEKLKTICDFVVEEKDLLKILDILKKIENL
ncbi:MAG: HAD-IB family phosphatase [Candidatus Aenigmatarchaeota archaeon]